MQFIGYEEKWMSTLVFVMNHVEIKELETSGYSALATPSSDVFTLYLCSSVIFYIP
jgi:hypothetical protein